MRLSFLAALLCIATPASAQDDDDAGWVPLFNGETLAGWGAGWAQDAPAGGRDPASLFTVENGTIHVYAHDEAGSRQAQAYIVTDGDYRDYRLSLEYKWGTKKFVPRTELVRDAGLLFHVYDHSMADWPHSVEAQIQEGDTGDLWAISSRASSTILPLTGRYMEPAGGGIPVTVGAYRDFERIRHGALNELPEWNTLEIVVRGDTATYIVNGFVNMRVTGLQRWDAATNSWARLDHGKIALQAEYAELFYRNIRIRPLTADDSE